MLILLGSVGVVVFGLFFVAHAWPNIVANLRDLQHYQYLE